MATPTQKHTTSRRNNRRSHFALKGTKLAKCSHCGAEVVSHTVCKNCGYYGKKQMIDVLKKLSKREKKVKVQELKGQEKEVGHEGHDHKN